MKKFKLFLKFKRLFVSVDYISDWLLFVALCLLVAFVLVIIWL